MPQTSRRRLASNSKSFSPIGGNRLRPAQFCRLVFELLKRKFLIILAACFVLFCVYKLILPKYPHLDSASSDVKVAMETIMEVDRNRALTMHGRNFYLNGKKFRILSGSMHYFRIPPEYWPDRLQKAKQCGLNTITTYVPWNLHELTPGQFNFLGQLDLVRFVRLAHEAGLFVIVRPGPYICSEWDFGGLPGWLLQDHEMQVRTIHPKFVTAVERYFKELLPLLSPLQWSNGGPIIAVQLENEYGSYGSDKTYLRWLKALLQKHFSELLFTSDGWQLANMERGSLPELLATINTQKHVVQGLNQLAQFQPDRPMMVAEFWTGWFDYWGSNEGHHLFDLESYGMVLKQILNGGASVNLYMFHGGTNFGFLNGATSNPEGADPAIGTYKPDVTSYDYDAPLNEWGALTEKYALTQQILEPFQKQQKPSQPQTVIESGKQLQQLPQTTDAAGIGPRSYRDVIITRYVGLTDALAMLTPVEVSSPRFMEEICLPRKSNSPDFCVTQNFGYIVYRYALKGSGLLRIEGTVADYLLVLVDGRVVLKHYNQLVGVAFNRTVMVEHNNNNQGASSEQHHDLILLVENMGRVNFGYYPQKLDQQRKGFRGRVLWKGEELDSAVSASSSKWQTYSLELDIDFMQQLVKKTYLWRSIRELNSANNVGSNGIGRNASSLSMTSSLLPPAFYYGTLEVGSEAELGDTLLRCDERWGWSKGAMFVNSANVGRYWSVGPQRTFYVPKSALRSQLNELVLFELHSSALPLATEQRRVQLVDKADLGPKVWRDAVSNMFNLLV